MFTFSQAEHCRITEGEYASAPRAPAGAFIIPLEETKVHGKIVAVKIQARTFLEEGWEILEAEQVQSIGGRKEKDYKCIQMPMSIHTARNLKRAFWHPTDLVVMLMPIAKDNEIIIRESHVIRMGRPMNGKLFVPQTLML